MSITSKKAHALISTYNSSVSTLSLLKSASSRCVARVKELTSMLQSFAPLGPLGWLIGSYNAAGWLLADSERSRTRKSASKREEAEARLQPSLFPFDWSPDERSIRTQTPLDRKSDSIQIVALDCALTIQIATLSQNRPFQDNGRCAPKPQASKQA